MPKKTAIIYIIITAMIALIVGVWSGSYKEEEYTDAEMPPNCNVLVATMEGYLTSYSTGAATEEEPESKETSSTYILDAIQMAEKNPQIKAFLLSIDSGGGDTATGEEIASALKALDKPSVALIRSVGASAAYWAATGADTIFASRVSDVGSIGVTASYLDESRKNAQEGYTYVPLTSAPYKDAGVPYRALTVPERTALLSDIKKIHEVFVDDVAANRNLDRKKVAELANGLTYLGMDAVEYGLVDKLGGLADVIDHLGKEIGEPVELCWY